MLVDENLIFILTELRQRILRSWLIFMAHGT